MPGRPENGDRTVTGQEPLTIPEGPGRWLTDAETERIRAAIPSGIDPRLVRPMLRLLGPARMILDRCAQENTPCARDEAADMAQRIVDWIGHPVTDEPAWATLPCEQPHEIRTEEHIPGNPLAVLPCRTCRPCMARMAAGYAPGLVDGVPVIDERPASTRPGETP
jgi:hypothetical protein